MENVSINIISIVMKRQQSPMLSQEGGVKKGVLGRR